MAFRLENSSTKINCPQCGKKSLKRFKNEAGEYADDVFGRCDREAKCGYLNKPQSNEPFKPFTPPPPKPLVYMPKEVLYKTLGNYENNTFLNALAKKIPADVLEEAVEMYYLGTTSTGANCFPFLDFNGNVRAIQTKLFDENAHTTQTNWLHTTIKSNLLAQKKAIPDWISAYLANDLKVSCLFGEHLLKLYPHNEVFLVEAPKSAIVGNCYFGSPKRVKNNPIWLAVYNLSSLSEQKCAILRGRKVVLMPDLSKKGIISENGKLDKRPLDRIPLPHKMSEFGKAWHLWKEKADDLKTIGIELEVSLELEKLANEHDRESGADIADFMLDTDFDFWQKND